MAQGVAYRNGTTFYAVNLSSSTADVSDTVTRVNWTANVQFGNWYYWGLRLHVAVDGVEVGNWAGACGHSGQVVINVSGSRDIARGDGGRDVKVEAWTTSETVNGFGGVGTTTSCAETRGIPAIAYRVPDVPSGVSAWRNHDGQCVASWTNNPSGTVRKYTGLQVERAVDGGGWERVADLGATATRYVDNATSAGHRYAYRVRAKNNAGWSGFAISGWAYTTPSSPRACSASRVSDSQQRVTWSLGASASHTWGGVAVERSTDGGGWVQVARLGGAATNYTDNGTSPNHRYAYHVRSHTPSGLWSGYASSGHVYTTPAAPSTVSAAATGPTGVNVTAGGLPPYASAYQIERRGESGGWGGAKTASSFPVAMPSAAGVNYYRVRAGRDGMWSGWRESAPVTTIAVPLAPTITGVPAVYALGSTAEVAWTANHPDGSAQTAAELEITKPDGSISTVGVEGTRGSAAVEFDAIGTWRLRARTHGAHADWGAWSGYAEAPVAAPPIVTITRPATDSAAMEVVPFSATWDVADATGVASQTLRLLSPDGSALHTVELGGEARSYEFRAGTYLPANMASYVMELTVRGGSTLAAAAERSFVADYAEPATPAAEVSYTPELGAEVSVRHGRGGWELDGWALVVPEPFIDEDGIPITSGIEVVADGTIALGAVMPTESVSVVRLMPDGSQWLVSEGMADGETARDPLPPLETDFTYMVTAYSDVGTATTHEAAARVAADAVAINYGPAASGFIPLRCDVKWSRDYVLATELMDFADGGEAGGLPTAYTTGAAKVTGSISGTAIGRAAHDALDALARRHAVAWIRDPHGRRALCAIGLGLSGAVPRDVVGVALSLTETAWREAWDG